MTAQAMNDPIKNAAEMVNAHRLELKVATEERMQWQHQAQRLETSLRDVLAVLADPDIAPGEWLGRLRDATSEAWKVLNDEEHTGAST